MPCATHTNSTWFEAISLGATFSHRRLARRLRMDVPARFHHDGWTREEAPGLQAADRAFGPLTLDR